MAHQQMIRNLAQCVPNCSWPAAPCPAKLLHAGRTWFLVVMFVAGLAAVAWAVYGSRLPPADFTFDNETEVPRSIRRWPRGSRRCGSFLRCSRDCVGRGRIQQFARGGRGGEVGDFRRRPRVHVSFAGQRPVVERRAGDGARFCLLDSAVARSADLFALLVSGVVHREREEVHACQSVIAPGDPVEVELNPAGRVPNTVAGNCCWGS